MSRRDDWITLAAAAITAGEPLTSNVCSFADSVLDEADKRFPLEERDERIKDLGEVYTDPRAPHAYIPNNDFALVGYSCVICHREVISPIHVWTTRPTEHVYEPHPWCPDFCNACKLPKAFSHPKAAP